MPQPDDGAQQKGFVLISAILTMAGLLALTQVGLTRSLVERFAANLFVARQQAFEIAAFGVDSDAEGNDYVLQVVITGRAKKAIVQVEKPFQTLLRSH